MSMSNVVRLLLLAVFLMCTYVVELGVWRYLRFRRLREGQGDIRAMPFSLLGGNGLPWPYAAVAFVVGIGALVVFVHG
jgi:hypothetical protein